MAKHKAKRRKRAAKPRKRARRRKAPKIARVSKPKRTRRRRARKAKPVGGRIMAKRRRRASKVASSKSSSKKGFPAWIKPTVSMVIGGGVGLVAMALLPEAIAPYAPALGVLGSKMIGGGSWGKYASVAAVVGGVTFLSRRQTVQVASGALAAAKASLTSGSGSSFGGGLTAGSGAGSSTSASAQGNDILRKAGIR